LRLLVTGAGGVLGRRFVEEARGAFEVIPTYHGAPAGGIGLDVAEARRVEEVIGRARADVVVHLAAATDVDRCEVEKDLATRVNAEGTRNVARAAARVGAKVVYVSTDYVFDGRKGWYGEDCPTDPINHYGLSKLRGEAYARELCADHLVVRSSVIFGWHPRKVNFATWVVKSLREGKRIEVVDDHYNTPTSAANLARGILEAIRRGGRGIFHMAGRDRLSRFEFAVKIAEAFGFSKELIRPIGMAELRAWIAKRPRDSSLDCGRAARELNVRLPGIEKSLEEMKGGETDS